MKKYKIIHERLGHSNKKVIRQMKLLSADELNVVDRVLLNDINNTHKCKICLYGEFPKFPYQKNRSFIPSQIGEQVFVDLCGPLSVQQNEWR